MDGISGVGPGGGRPSPVADSGPRTDVRGWLQGERDREGTSPASIVGADSGPRTDVRGWLQGGRDREGTGPASIVGADSGPRTDVRGWLRGGGRMPLPCEGE
jgi:hypothetical protein